MTKLYSKINNAKPFIKWAGGKTQLLEKIRLRYPIKTEITRYCEPFVGGGAVLFDVASHYELREILINDINAELINAYTVVRDKVESLITTMVQMEKEYLEKDKEKRKIYYYHKRETFNELKTNSKPADIEKASLFIFLNRTCFNGLYRVNSKGQYNVPMGDYKNPTICDSKNLREASNILQSVRISSGDYSECIGFINQNTFVYIDPPYRPLTKTSKFTSYTESQFGDQDQLKLGRFVDKANDLGAKIILSNSDPKNSVASDTFFDDLYHRYSLERISAKRMINSCGNNRGNINEILVKNY